MTPAIIPGHSEPSRSKNFTPRNQPIASNTGSAPMERTNACSIGGTSGSTSLTATWLKPQLRHSISINATAPGVSARPAEEIIWLDDIYPRGRRERRVDYWHDPGKLAFPLRTRTMPDLNSFLTMRAGAGNLDDGELWRKSRGARRGIEALRDRGCRNFADRAAVI